MRYLMPRTIQLIVLAMFLPLWPMGDAGAQFEGALRGEYNVTLYRSCSTTAIESPMGSGFFLSDGSPSIVLQGIVTYNGTGGGTFVGQVLSPVGGGPAGSGISLGVPPGGTTAVEVIPNRFDLAPCTVTYAVNGNGTFTQQFNCTATFLTGGSTGLSNIQSFVSEGRLSLDGTVLLLGKSSASLEQFSFVAGPFAGQSFNRLCNAHGTATSRR